MEIWSLDHVLLRWIVIDGLIVKEPFALQLVTGKKDVEYRSTPLPKNKTDRTILILNGKFAIGSVTFGGQWHDVYSQSYRWFVIRHKQFSPYMKYNHKNGCVIWINDVDLIESWLDGKCLASNVVKDWRLVNCIVEIASSLYQNIQKV